MEYIRYAKAMVLPADFLSQCARKPPAPQGLNQPCFASAAGLYLRKGQVQQSLAAYGKAIELSPDSDDLYFNRGNAHQV